MPDFLRNQKNLRKEAMERDIACAMALRRVGDAVEDFLEGESQGNVTGLREAFENWKRVSGEGTPR